MPDDSIQHIRRSALILLQRIVAAGLAERFQLRDVCPTDCCQFWPALDNLTEWGHCERITERVGRWHYRLTPLAHAALAGEPISFGVGYATPNREYVPVSRGLK